MNEAKAVVIAIVGLAVFVYAIIYATFGTMLVYGDLFPPHGHTVCLVSHDEEHGGATYTLCDKRVPR